MKIPALLLITAVAVAGGWALFGQSKPSGAVNGFRTVAVERGDVLVTVNATGTLEPEDAIDIGAQIVGRIKEFGADPRGKTDPKFADAHIDYNTPVEEGTVLARIDPSIYQAQYDQAFGALERAKADLLQLEAKAYQAEVEWQRAQKLQNLSVPAPSASATAGSGAPSVVRTAALQIQAISNSDYILAKANYEIAKANVEVGRAVVVQQKGVLDLAKTNLDYTVIKAPMKGTILARRVNIGQTVVASLNAPSLFLLAKDLHKMEVWASVNEADIGQLKVDTPVTFTVDAFPGETFHGRVKQVRFDASMTSNVVTYTTVVSVENPDLKLLPYLTADVKFEISRHENVLKVPNAALRYQPPADWIVATKAAPADAKSTAGGSGEKQGAKKAGTLWVVTPEGLSPIAVTRGASDDNSTEISGPGVKDGLQVVTGVAEAGAVEQVNNPFAPRFGGAKPSK